MTGVVKEVVMRSNWNKRMGLLVLCTCLVTVLVAQPRNADSTMLYWTKNRRLRLQDFGGTPTIPDTIFIGPNSRSYPHRLGTIATAIDVHVKRERMGTTFTVRAVMDKNRSWIRNDGDSVSLRHEQGHFDICEIYTRVMRRELRKATTLAGSKAIYEAVLAAESAEQDAYDRANTYEKGGITKPWADRITRRLKQLQPYTNPTIILKGI